MITAIDVIPNGGGKYVGGESTIAAIMTVINALVDDDSNIYTNSSLLSGVCPSFLCSDFASAAKANR